MSASGGSAAILSSRFVGAEAGRPYHGPGHDTLSTSTASSALGRWLRWISASALLLIALICTVGAIRAFTHDLPDSTVGTGVFAAVIALGFGTAAFFLVRPEISTWTRARIGEWFRLSPLGQALAFSVAAGLCIVAAPSWALLFVFGAVCGYSVVAALTIATCSRWWLNAMLSVVGWLMVFGVTVTAAETLRKRSMGEDGMILLLPMTVFPILLAVSGIFHWTRTRRRNP
jgi:hypothetical protein